MKNLIKVGSIWVDRLYSRYEVLITDLTEFHAVFTDSSNVEYYMEHKKFLETFKIIVDMDEEMEKL